MPETEYPRAERWETPGLAEDFLAQLADLANASGVDLGPTLANGREAITRASAFKAEFAARETDRSAAAKRLGRQLGSGAIDLDAAVLEALAVEALAPGSVLARAIPQAETFAISEATATLARDIDGAAVLKQARVIAADTLERIRRLRPVIGDAETAEQATDAGPKVATAWSSYRTELLPRWEACHEIVKELRKVHWVAPLPVHLQHFGRYQRPDLAREDTQAAKRSGLPLLPLLDPRCERWGPTGPHTEEEAARFATAMDEAAAADAQRERRTAARLAARPGVAA